MSDVLIDLLLPRTDAGVAAQVIGAVVVFVVAGVLVRRSRDLLWFVGGLASVTFAWFAVRTLH
jgi:hypothetical protein